jgi:ComF family protein
MNYELRTKLIKSAKKLKALFLDLIFPVECLGCEKEGVWFCHDCFRNIQLKDKQFCLHCKKENSFGEFCENCGNNYSLDGVWIAGDYEDELITKLVKSLKYRFMNELSGSLGRFMSLFLRDLINKNRLTGNDLHEGEIWRRLDKIKGSPKIFLNLKESLIIPVPLHIKRKRWRGFNQAEVIARELVNYFNLDLSTEKLVRIKHAKAQAKLGEEERKNNIKNCFAWKSEELDGRNVVLVDDVATTGSTLNECARVLKDNGAGEVWGLVVAKG